MRVLRLLRIVRVVWAYGLDDLLLPRRWRWSVRLGRRITATPRGERLQLALESLGPIFVKFGQVLSTRRDLIPADIADRLALLQDRVAPFPGEEAVAVLERAYRKPLKEVFGSFEVQPVASASVAQVHFATLPDGREVAVKVLRPGIDAVIASDRPAPAVFAQQARSLGLAMVKKIADEHRARVALRNRHADDRPENPITGARVSISFFALARASRPAAAASG